MFLHGRNIDDFRERLRCGTEQIRARIFFSEEIRLDIRKWIVAENRAAPLFRPNDMHALWHMRTKVDDAHLIREPVVDIDLFGSDARRRQTVDDGRYQFRMRVDLRRSRAIHFDSNHIARRNELRPGIAVALSARQLT